MRNEKKKFEKIKDFAKRESGMQNISKPQKFSPFSEKLQGVEVEKLILVSSGPGACPFII